MAATTFEDDVEIYKRVGRGDWEGMRLLFERHHGWMYDLAIRTVRDPDRAEDVVESAVLDAWESLGQEDSLVRGVSWLAMRVQHGALEALRQPSDGDSVGVELASFVPVTPNDPRGSILVLEDRELAELVWLSAAALAPADYCLLHLHLRTGLTSNELADGLGERPGDILTRIERLKATLDESATDYFLARRGSYACPELASILSANPDDTLPIELRLAIRRHFHRCPTCQKSARALTSPIEVFEKLPLVPLASDRLEALWARIEDRARVPAISRVRRWPFGRQWWTERFARLRQARPNLILGVVVPAVVVALAIVLTNVLWPEHAPRDAHSTTHEIGKASSDNVVTIAWTVLPDARAYSVGWTPLRKDFQHNVPNLPGTATEAKSPPLDPGDWYFHLQTQDQNGRWTTPLDLGPYVIGPPTPTPSPTDVLPTPTMTPPAPSPTDSPVTFAVMPDASTASASPTPPPPPAAPQPNPIIIVVPGQPTNTPALDSPTPAATATRPATDTPEITTATSSPLPTITPSSTVASTSTATPTPVPPTASATAAATSTNLPTASVTAAATATTPATASATVAATPSAIATASATPAPSSTSSSTPAPSATAVKTSTPVPTQPATATHASTAVVTPASVPTQHLAPIGE